MSRVVVVEILRLDQDRLNATEEEIKEAFGGKDDITAEFNLEWTE